MDTVFTSVDAEWNQATPQPKSTTLFKIKGIRELGIYVPTMCVLCEKLKLENINVCAIDMETR